MNATDRFRCQWCGKMHVFPDTQRYGVEILVCNKCGCSTGRRVTIEYAILQEGLGPRKLRTRKAIRTQGAGKIALSTVGDPIRVVDKPRQSRAKMVADE